MIRSSCFDQARHRLEASAIRSSRRWGDRPNDSAGFYLLKQMAGDWFGHETQARAVRADTVRRFVGLDPMLGQARKCGIEVRMGHQPIAAIGGGVPVRLTSRTPTFFLQVSDVARAQRTKDAERARCRGRVEHASV